jgi:hypothetical protein
MHNHTLPKLTHLAHTCTQVPRFSQLNPASCLNFRRDCCISYAYLMAEIVQSLLQSLPTVTSRPNLSHSATTEYNVSWKRAIVDIVMCVCVGLCVLLPLKLMWTNRLYNLKSIKSFRSRGACSVIPEGPCKIGAAGKGGTLLSQMGGTISAASIWSE